VAATPQEIYQRYLWVTLTQNADAVAEMFTMDGVLRAPLVRAGQAIPRNLEGREAIHTRLAEYYHRWAGDQQRAGLAGLTVPGRQRFGPAIRRDCRGCNPVAGLWVVHPRFIVPVPDNLRKCRPSHCDGRADWVLPFGRCHRSGDKEKRIWRRPVESPASWAFAP